MSYPINQIEQVLMSKLKEHLPLYFKSIILEMPFIPINLPVNFNKPETTKDLHEAMKQLVRYQKSGTRKGWTIDWKDLGNVKKFGKQDWPKKITIAAEEDYLYLLNEKEMVADFKEQLMELIVWNNSIREWLAAKPNNVLKYKEKWKSICSCVYSVDSLQVVLEALFIGNSGQALQFKYFDLEC